jgi:hypothetical protein
MFCSCLSFEGLPTWWSLFPVKQEVKSSAGMSAGDKGGGFRGVEVVSRETELKKWGRAFPHC